MENNIVLSKALRFAVDVVMFSRDLPMDSRVLGHQLVRSGTAIGALITEAQGAESRVDFMHKLKIADKAAKETLYWLDLLKSVGRGGDQTELRNGLNELCRILGSIISTCRKREREKGRQQQQHEHITTISQPH